MSYFFDNYLFSYKTEWEKLLDSNSNKIDPHNPKLAFGDEEQSALVNLPRKTYNLQDKERVPVFLSLLDILFGECYDERINEGETGPESGWCVGKLSATLAGCTKHKSLKDVVISSIRRLDHF